MKTELCHAFCDELVVRNVPDGLAVSTAFKREDGDSVGFYVVPAGNGLFRLEDSGTTIPQLMEAGVDFDVETRAKALSTLLSEYEVAYDQDESMLHTLPMKEGAVPRAAMRFVALLLRIDDFLLLTQERAASTFKEDAAKRVREALEGRAAIRENEPISHALGEVVPDMVLEASSRKPVALFFGTSAQRVNDAVFLQMAALLEHVDVSVVALLENDNSVSQDLRRRAANRLTTVPVFRRDEVAAISRIQREVLGSVFH